MKYLDMARRAEDYIKGRVARNYEDRTYYITYGELHKFLGIDWRTCGWMLGELVKLNAGEGVPLWSSFVSYSDNQHGEKGMPAPNFKLFAAQNGIGLDVDDEKEFVYQQRELCWDRVS